MFRRVALAWLWTAVLTAQTPEDPDTVLARVSAKVKQNLDRLPNYVCLETIQRSRRSKPGASFEPRDTLQVEVGLVGNRELYSWPGAQSFDEKDLADMVGSGVVGTGNFGLFARHVFLARVAEFTARGEELLEGRRVLRFDFAVDRELSSYRLRVPPHQAIVGFHGTLWADATTLDLLRLEVQADDIPPELNLAGVHIVLDYGRLRVADGTFLLPASSELTMTTLQSDESRNLSKFSACRQYQSESKLALSETYSEAPEPKPAGLKLAAAAQIELALDEAIDLENAIVGNPVRAVLAKALKDGERVMVPEGSAVTGRLVRLEKETLPFEHYVVGFEFDGLESGGQAIRFHATLRDSDSAPGLMRQSKKMDPSFVRRRGPKIEILVGEQHRGQGVLLWDARHPQIHKGFKMRWQTDGGQ